MIKIENISSKDKWKALLDQFPEANFLQSYNWGLFQESMGCLLWRLAAVKDGRCIALASVYLEKAKRGFYFSCPGGPLFRKEDTEVLGKLTAYLQLLAKQERAWFFRCRPQLEDKAENAKYFIQRGFLESPLHMSAETTICLDLLQTEEELLNSMRKNTRYAVRRAEKSNLEFVKSNDPKDVLLLYRLQMETQKKQGFVPFSLEFLQKQFQAFSPDSEVYIFKILDKGAACAAAFIIFYRGEAVYHYAGNSKLAYKNNASYLLQWKIIKEAKKMGFRYYNLWGIAPKGSTGHRFAGVSIFKSGFGGKVVSYLHAKDFPFSPFYKITRMFELWRKHQRKL